MRITPKRLFNVFAGCLFPLLLILFTITEPASAANAVTCSGGIVTDQPIQAGSSQPDLLITGSCTVPIGTAHQYYYGNVNIINGGSLIFDESYGNPGTGTKTDFWTSAIIVENGGALKAWNSLAIPNRFGQNGGVLTIHLYGEDNSSWDPVNSNWKVQNTGAPCQTPTSSTVGPCGIPLPVWNSNGSTPQNLPNNISDYFYQYGPMYADNGNANAYFGKKVIGVSYGGAISLQGYKGTTDSPSGPLDSGNSWMRLADGASLSPGASSLILERTPTRGWAIGDEIVVTTTDYLPAHSEHFRITLAPLPVLNFTGDASEPKTVQYPHMGTRYGGAKDESGNPFANRLPARIQTNLDPQTVIKGIETRASVALLTRSIRVVSEGDAAGAPFPNASTGYFFGGHMMFRQGFSQVAISGVEFKQMGQGGKIGHYPLHFHLARNVNNTAVISDSSVNESMTRCYVVHDTQGVTLQRNVGYKSMGHCFYLEDATESDNKFYSNIGIFARAAVQQSDGTPHTHNPRKVPGILANSSALGGGDTTTSFQAASDVFYPSVFWITNGWNDFEGNMAAGAQGCGSAYWFVPASSNNVSDLGTAMNWTGTGYAELNLASPGGNAPLKRFSNNFATSTMQSFVTISQGNPCFGFVGQGGAVTPLQLQAVPSYNPVSLASAYYTKIVAADIVSTQCPPSSSGGKPNCDVFFGTSQINTCTGSPNSQLSPDPFNNCAVNYIDHYTSSFHWAESGFSAIWLRQNWFALDQSALTDVQGGGYTMVTGGDFTRSSAPAGYWSIGRNNIFIGHTRNNTSFPLSRDIGPFNADSNLQCANANLPSYCLSLNEGVSFQVSGVQGHQRLSNIYDGPTYEDSNSFLDIRPAGCDNKHSPSGGAYVAGWPSKECIYAGLLNVLVPSSPGGICQLPNAAIGWKQPNGFYYPPAFHINNSFFDNVAIRHFVTQPQFQAGTYNLDPTQLAKTYCTISNVNFSSFSDIDRQTELNDDDGSLTGLLNNYVASALSAPFRIKMVNNSVLRAYTNPALNQTVSVNKDSFFNAPNQADECASVYGQNGLAANACQAPNTNLPATSKTSPYDFVTTALAPDSSSSGTASWTNDCTTSGCFGVPMYRQYLTGVNGLFAQNSSREWQQWWASSCNTTPCKWPMIRMAGTATTTVSSLTANNGRYYIETTNSSMAQGGFGGQIVFVPNAKYNVFFLYAKPTTAQIYDIYVGTGSAVQAVPIQVNITNFPYQATPYTGPTSFLTQSYNPTSGILTVTVNFNQAGNPALPLPDSSNSCYPRTFCQPDITTAGACTTALPITDTRYIASKNICAKWAVKDLDCPATGCLGFSFTTTAAFAADDKVRRPAPQPFPTVSLGLPPWAVGFSNTTTVPDNSNNAKGQCWYAPPLPATTQCPSHD